MDERSGAERVTSQAVVDVELPLRYMLAEKVVNRIKIVLVAGPLYTLRGEAIDDLHVVIHHINQGTLTDESLAKLATKRGNVQPHRVYA